MLFPIRITEDFLEEDENKNEVGDEDDSSVSHWSENSKLDCSPRPAAATIRIQNQTASDLDKLILEEEKSVNMACVTIAEEISEGNSSKDREHAVILGENSQIHNEGAFFEGFQVISPMSTNAATLVEKVELENLNQENVGDTELKKAVLGPEEKNCVSPELIPQHLIRSNGSGRQESIEGVGPINSEPIILSASSNKSCLRSPSQVLGPDKSSGPNKGHTADDLEAAPVLNPLESTANQGLGTQRKISKKMKKRMEKTAFTNFVGGLASPSEQEPNSAPTLLSDQRISEMDGKHSDASFRKEAIEIWAMGKKMGLKSVSPESEVISRIEGIVERVDGQMVEGKEKDKFVS